MKTFSDEELIKWLRGWHFPDCQAAAYRIEQLVATNEQLVAINETLVKDYAEACNEAADCYTKQCLAEAKLAKAMKLIGFAIELARFDSNPKLLDGMIYFKTEFELEKAE